MIVSVCCPVCRADVGSAPKEFYQVVSSALLEIHKCR